MEPIAPVQALSPLLLAQIRELMAADPGAQAAAQSESQSQLQSQLQTQLQSQPPADASGLAGGIAPGQAQASQPGAAAQGAGRLPDAAAHGMGGSGAAAQTGGAASAAPGGDSRGSQTLAALELPPGLAHVVLASRGPASSADAAGPQRTQRQVRALERDAGQRRQEQEQDRDQQEPAAEQAGAEALAAALPDGAPPDAWAPRVDDAGEDAGEGAPDAADLRRALQRAGLQAAVAELDRGRWLIAVLPESAELQAQHAAGQPVQVWLGRLGSPMLRAGGIWRRAAAREPARAPAPWRQWPLRVQERPGQLPRTLQSAPPVDAAQPPSPCRVRLGGALAAPDAFAGDGLDIPAGLRLARALGAQRTVVLVAPGELVR